MIPSVEIRQVRPCCDCISIDTARGNCQHDFGIPMLRDNYGNCFDSKLEIEATKEYPCIYHMTPGEYRENIDSGAIK